MSASYLITGELGDYNPKIMVDSYVSEFRFVPDQVRGICVLIMSRSLFVGVNVVPLQAT